MLMVIFGAGASYDSSSEFPPPPDTRANSPESWRPPLANYLFSNNPQRTFSHIVKEYPKLTHVLPYLRERPGGRSVEEVLEQLLDEAKAYPERRRELASIQYYLRDFLFEVTNKWIAETDGVTNYAPLIGEILRLNRPKEPVALVTFNYDLLLDNALFSFDYKPRQPEDQFTAHPVLKLFKPHGSVDWARTVKLPDGDVMRARGLIEEANTIELTDEILNVSSPHSADANPSKLTRSIVCLK
jgi:hypothetical protein